MNLATSADGTRSQEFASASGEKGQEDDRQKADIPTAKPQRQSMFSSYVAEQEQEQN